jgi:radical SAM protein (TIGR01212 family)
MYLSLNRYLRGIFGERVQKVSLDAGLTCPNRDGTKGTGGCVYCDAGGSGTGGSKAGKDVAQQMREGIQQARKRYGAEKFIAYFQSFSNTYAAPERLEGLYSQALVGPEVVGLSVGTRPDCVDHEKLALIARVGRDRMVWMEYGLQSASDATLSRINRGHTARDFIHAVGLAREYGFPVCAHVIFGLPGEGRTEMEDTVHLLAGLKIDGVKFHQLYVVEGTALHRLHEVGGYRPMEQAEYAGMVAWALRALPAGTVIQRLTGDPPRDRTVVAPAWSYRKAETTALIKDALISIQK